MYYGERLNSISHLVGGVFALVGLGALVTLGIQTEDPLVIFAFTIYGLTLVLLYSMSTLYHSFHQTQLKRIFKVLDHIAIYLLIAGTYTPFMLVTVHDRTGWLILGLVWGLAVIGILSELLLSGRAVKVGQMIIYLGMGWACSLDIGSIKTGLPGMGFFWLYIGGLAYTGGVFFYVADSLKRLSHAHGIWHFFVLVGSVCHFVSVIGYVR